MLPLLLVFGLALVLGIAAIALLSRADVRARHDDVALRMRVLGEDAGDLQARDPTGNRLTRFVAALLTRAGIELPPERINQGLFAAVALIPLLLGVLGALAGTMAIGLAAVAVYGVLSRNAIRRRRQIVEQLPGFLESVMRVLAAGNTLEEALAAAARESPEPIRPLFVSIGRQVRLGASIEQVLSETADIYRLRDLKVMALAASINRKYGGSLRQVLKSLITSIRSRDTAARELRALTAETRFSALVLAIIPVTLSLYIFSRNTSYYAGMWADSVGRWFLIFSIVLQVAGVAVLWRMMNSTEDPDA